MKSKKPSKGLNEKVHVLDEYRRLKRAKMQNSKNGERVCYQIPRDEHLGKAIEDLKAHTGSTTDSDVVRDALRMMADLISEVDVSTSKLLGKSVPFTVKMEEQVAQVDVSFEAERIKPITTTGRVKFYCNDVVDGFVSDALSAYELGENDRLLFLSFSVQLFAGLHKLVEAGAAFNVSFLNSPAQQAGT